MTVSRVMQGGAQLVTPATRERVLLAARELNYVPIRTAVQKQNRRVRTHVMSVVFDHTVIKAHQIDSETFYGIRRAALRHGYDLLVNLRSQPEFELDGLPRWLLDRRSDGFIFVNPRYPEETYRAMEALTEHGIPSVSCFHADVPAGVPWVAADSAQGMRFAVRHLKELGHRHIGHLTGPVWHSETRLRREGYLAAMQLEQLEVSTNLIVSGHESYDAGAALDQFLSEGATAVICWNDERALSLWKLAEARGIRVPNDFSLVGMDDSPMADYTGLTSLTNPLTEIGEFALEFLHETLGGNETAGRAKLVPVELKVRKSVAEPRGIAVTI